MSPLGQRSRNVARSVFCREERGEGFVLSANHGALLCGQKDMVRRAPSLVVMVPKKERGLQTVNLGGRKKWGVTQSHIMSYHISRVCVHFR